MSFKRQKHCSAVMVKIKTMVSKVTSGVASILAHHDQARNHTGDVIKDSSKPILQVTHIGWKGTSGVICGYTFLVTDGVDVMDMELSSNPDVRRALYSLVRGKHQKLITFSLVQVKDYVLVASSTSPVLVARALRVVRRGPAK